jgi:hypothetical protein
MNTTTEIAMDRIALLICKGAQKWDLVEAVDVWAAMAADIDEDRKAGVVTDPETLMLFNSAKRRALELAK